MDEVKLPSCSNSSLVSQMKLTVSMIIIIQKKPPNQTLFCEEQIVTHYSMTRVPSRFKFEVGH